MSIQRCLSGKELLQKFHRLNDQRKEDINISTCGYSIVYVIETINTLFIYFQALHVVFVSLYSGVLADQHTKSSGSIHVM